MLLTTGNKSEMARRLRHHLWRHERRLQSDQGHAQDAGLSTSPPGAMPTCPATASGPAGEVIPQAIIDKAPSAELRPDQTDQDSLPPYPVLDEILDGAGRGRTVGRRDRRAQGYRPRAGQAHREAGLHRRIQAPAVGARASSSPRKAFGLGPQIPDHQRLPRRDAAHEHDRRPLRAVPDRAPPSGQCPAGAAQLALRPAHGGQLRAAPRRHRHRRAPPTNSPTASRTIWPGSASRPTCKVRQSDRTALYDAARDRLIAAGRLYPCLRDRGRTRPQARRAPAPLGKPPIYDRAALNLTDEQKRRATRPRAASRTGASGSTAGRCSSTT